MKTEKVNSSSPSPTKDIFDYIKTLVKKSHINVILHTGSNDVIRKQVKTVLNNIISLRHFIETSLPTDIVHS